MRQVDDIASKGRFALYFAPRSGTALDRFGAHWLGYDAQSGELLPQPTAPGFAPSRIAEITAEARQYGFHATLKPPFRLAEGHDSAALQKEIAALAARHAAFTAPPLKLASIAGFWALVLSAPCPAMGALAAACVAELDPFRAPPEEVELVKRRRVGLTPAQDALLLRWGYPYVMAEFRFHMTLSARLGAEEGERLRRALAPLVAPICAEPLRVDALALFHQPNSAEPLRLVERYPLSP